MTEYLNSFHMPKNPCSKQRLNCDRTPSIYKGFYIYHRINATTPIENGAHVFDVVKDGVCVGMYAGPNGAKKFIDSINVV